MIDVGGNNHPAAGHFVAHEFGRDLFTMSHVAHLFRDDAPARIVHLREVAVAVLPLAPGKPVCARLGGAVGVIAVAGSFNRGSHVRASFPSGFGRSDYTCGRGTSNTS